MNNVSGIILALCLIILVMLLPSAYGQNRDIYTPRDESTMVFIPAGSFTMGIDKATLEKAYKYDGYRVDIFESELHKKNMHLPGFYIDKYEVTNRQYEKFMRETGHRMPRYWGWRSYNQPAQPVVGVNWADAAAYCNWAGKRLPKESEWEKAARGTDERWWPWGNEFRVGYANTAEYGLALPSPVGQFPKGASPYGVHDMAGNVWEMCDGEWGFRGDRCKVMRGGAFLSRAVFVRTTVRWCTKAENERNGAEWLGFRCVKDIR